ncbi:MAG: Ni/Fe-hydrogenase cytochrome b subunit [Deltaproteobacteria bacterium]|nr:Ni/Fe-hydrogenase cytochrome b subunit [Deltaproteobacteria bacterium]
MKRLLAFKSALWFVVGAAAVIATLRFWNGLGATTALTDLTPWGFWIGFDVTGGVALAAGGFVTAFAVYVLHLDRYHAIVRPAVLTAFLGYLAVVVALLFDLGLPWNIWHMIIFWNPKSPLFEVGWCVMLYTAVLSLEFGPVVLEPSRHPTLQKLYRLLKKATIPLVILGIMLSTLHQSSLGSLFLIMPHRLHPLWYTPMLPVLFFISAIGLALMMVTTESLVSSYLYELEPETELLQGLGKVGAWVLSSYALVKLVDVALRGRLDQLFAGTFSSNLFVAEMLVSAIIPAALLFIPAIRKKPSGLAVAAFLAVGGFVLNRLNVSGIATIESTGTRYVPSWMEVVVSLGVVAGAALVYFFVAEHFNLFHVGRIDKERFRYQLPGFDPRSGVINADPYTGGFASYSIMAVLGGALALALVPASALGETPIPPRPVTAPGFGEEIIIDGDRAAEAVLFNHQEHVDMEDGNCASCHHLLRPREQATGCSRCHRDMNLKTSIFDHTLHIARLKKGPGCVACHSDIDRPKDLAHSKPCLECHTGMIPEGAAIRPRDRSRLALAPGYTTAMHGLCIGCHEKVSKDMDSKVNRLDQCATCHTGKERALDPMNPDVR